MCCSIEELRGYTSHLGVLHLAACLSRNACAGWHKFIELGNFRARKEIYIRNVGGQKYEELYSRSQKAGGMIGARTEVSVISPAMTQ